MVVWGRTSPARRLLSPGLGHIYVHIREPVHVQSRNQISSCLGLRPDYFCVLWQYKEGGKIRNKQVTPSLAVFWLSEERNKMGQKRAQRQCGVVTSKESGVSLSVFKSSRSCFTSLRLSSICKTEVITAAIPQGYLWGINTNLWKAFSIVILNVLLSVIASHLTKSIIIVKNCSYFFPKWILGEWELGPLMQALIMTCLWKGKRAL